MHNLFKNPNQSYRQRLSMQKPRNAFALIIALVLMSFLLLLLVSLTTLTRVETQAFSSSQQAAQARQNALLALFVAIGQLQQYAGPDQRITARADVDATLSNTTTANGRWVGVYGSATPAGYNQSPSALASATTSKANAKGSQAVLLNWLVSGNETVAFKPTTDVAADGHILTAPTSLHFTPTSAINLSQATVQPGIDDKQALLVGKNSVGSAADYVAAPLVTISNGESSSATGRYAWWVGDEGAKAKVNLPIASADQLAAAFVSSQRNAIELANQNAGDGFTPNTLIGQNYPPSSSLLHFIHHVIDLPLVAASDDAAMRNAVKNRFHDLTANSYSVLSDTYAGGLKQDLSAILAKGANTPADSALIFTAESGATFSIPTWGALRSFAQTTAPSLGLVPRPPNSTDVGVFPVLTYISLGLQYAAPEGVQDNAPIRLAMFPMVVLWNPYTTTLKAHEYEVGIMTRYNPWYQLQVQEPSGTWKAKESVNFSTGARRSTTPSSSYVRFKIDAPDIPPGASLIFTLQGDESGAFYNNPSNSKPLNTLTNGLNAIGHVLVDFGSNTAVFETGEANSLFRVTGAHMLPPGGAYGMSGGELYAYLGEVSEKENNAFIAENDNARKWHQTIARLTPAQDGDSNKMTPPGQSVARNEFLQTEGTLTPVTGPTSAIYIQRTFGQSVSTTTHPDVRWIAQNNPRALYTLRTVDRPPSGFSSGGGMQSNWISFNVESSGKRASAGSAIDSGSGIVDATLFEFRPENQPLLSLGQLQHANLSTINTYPAYPIGNSLGDYHFLNKRDKLSLSLSNSVTPSTLIGTYYDISWLLNHALWDRYFVSTVPHAGTGKASDTNATPIPSPLANPRMVRNQGAADSVLRNANKAATGLMVNGGFNINSTSEQAWRAVLGGINQLPYDPVNQSNSATPLRAALPRFSNPTGSPSVANDQAWAWQGYRQLSEEQIAELARNIVAQIRNRGPFISMADFINRRLTDNPATTDDERFKGVIQAAIDTTYSGSAAINSGDADAYGLTGTNPFHTSQPPKYSSKEYDTELMQGHKNTPSGNIPHASLSAFAPQFLTQADVLSAIGANLSARSDTFIIRCYGESLDLARGEPDARAWCEAVVQRQVEYFDSEDTADTPVAELNELNKMLGRKFKIISFRWLSSEEI